MRTLSKQRRNTPPVVMGGQGRTAKDITSSVTTALWLAAQLVWIAAVICAIAVVNAASGPLLAAIAALACVVTGSVCYTAGRAS